MRAAKDRVEDDHLELALFTSPAPGEGGRGGFTLDDMTDAALPGASELGEQGFVALWDLAVTWSAVWKVWPEEHLRELPETRVGYLSARESRVSGPTCRFIRSPFPEVDLEQVLDVMRRRVTQHADWERNEERGVESAEEVLRMDTATLLAEAGLGEGE